MRRPSGIEWKRVVGIACQMDAGRMNGKSRRSAAGGGLAGDLRQLLREQQLGGLAVAE